MAAQRDGAAWPGRRPALGTGINRSSVIPGSHLVRPGSSVALPGPAGFAAVLAADLDLLQGTLDVLVLKTLSWGPRHGYAVARWIRDTSDGPISVEDRALYVALHRLETRGWLESEWGLSENNRRAKYYRLTAAGRRQLLRKTEDWTSYATAVFRILRTA